MAKTSGGVRGGSSARVMTQEQYLGSKGLASPVSDFMIDKQRIPHGMTARQRIIFEREAKNAAIDYSNRRQAAINEYNRLVSSGQIRQPSRVEQLIRTAQGNSDNEAVRAARRALEKRGIDWRKRRR